MTIGSVTDVAVAIALAGLAAGAGALGRSSGSPGPVDPGGAGPAFGGPFRWAPGGRGGRPGRREAPGSARWATRADLRSLAVAGPVPGRLALGVAFGRRHRTRRRRRSSPGHGALPLAAEPSQSLAVVGPTQSGKTTGLAVPAILEWEGPVVAASVKTDLVRDTLTWRRRCGHVWCFDPTGATGLTASRWSPVVAAGSWAGARRVAADLTEVVRGPATSADGEFWYATAAKLLAPLLFAAARSGAGVADVVRWVETQEVDAVLGLLEAAGCPEALQAARATWLRDERQRSAVYTTAETVLEAFADELATPGNRTAGNEDIDPEMLLGGPHTLYLCAPAHDQRRLRPLFVAVVKQVLETAFTRSARLGRPLDPALLVVLDEAANIAPLAELDGLAATCAGHGVQLVTVWQDLAQVHARYGDRAATVVNNHRAKLFLSGTSDPRTLDHASHLVGEEEVWQPSVAWTATGERSITSAPMHRHLLAPDALRRMAPGTGVLVYGSLAPVQVHLRPWYDVPALRRRARGTPAAGDGLLGRPARGRHRQGGPGALPSRRWQQRALKRWRDRGSPGRGRRPPTSTT